MKVLLAPDKFKGALSAAAVSQALAKGVKEAGDHAVTALPMADGGEGTMAVMVQSYGGTYYSARVHDPLMRPVEAFFALLGDGRTAYVEMAEASGAARLSEEELNCYHTTSYGTGELIQAALNKGVSALMLGLGGSATSDGGAGMAAALGAQFQQEEGLIEAPSGKDLRSLTQVNRANLDARLRDISLTVLCDVQHPLLGPEGAARTFAPQKGAGSSTVEALEEGLQHLSDLIQREETIDPQSEGSGAAGGMGFGGKAFLGGALEMGIEAVINATGFREQAPFQDLMITGEGKLDPTTARGKVVGGVAREARQHQVPVAVLCGQVEGDPSALQQLGITFSQSILTGPLSQEEAMAYTSAHLTRAASSLTTLLATALEQENGRGTSQPAAE
jgi:glycerate kinase